MIEKLLKLRQPCLLKFALRSGAHYFDLRSFTNELQQFIMKSLKKMHSETYLNELFEYEHSTRNTRRSTKNYLKIPPFKTQFERSSISYRCAKLFNTLRKNEVLAPNIEPDDWKKISIFYHKFKESYLLNNEELVSYIFK